MSKGMDEALKQTLKEAQKQANRSIETEDLAAGSLPVDISGLGSQFGLDEKQVIERLKKNKISFSKKKETKDTHISLAVTPSLKARLEQERLEAGGVTMNKFIIRILEAYLDGELVALED